MHVQASTRRSVKPHKTVGGISLGTRHMGIEFGTKSHMPQYHGLQVFNRSGPQTKCNSAQVNHLCTCIDLQCVFPANYCT